MKLTPLDIRHREFRRAVRGYSDEEVDIFLDEVADEFERLYQENIDLQERLRVLEDQVKQYENLKDTLQKTLVSAQKQADETSMNARKEAELILRDAELRGRDIVNEAYSAKQKVQQSLIQLKRVEEDFRFKFRSLLEAHLNLLSEDEVSEDRVEFQGLVTQVEAELQEGGSDEESAPLSSAGAGPAGAVPEADLPPFLREEETRTARGAVDLDLEPLPEGESADATAEHEPRGTSGTDENEEPDGGDDRDEERDDGVDSDDSDEDRERDGRRFLFGKKNSDDDNGFFSSENSREFEW
ncbi:MAG: hypothetical protein Kow00129_14230 [Thermoleophilia bacterium]